MRKFAAAVLLAVAALLPAPARAQLTGCQYTAGAWQLQKVRASASGSQIIGCINATFEALSSSVPVNSTSAVSYASWVHAARLSGMSTGTAGVRISSPVFSTDGAYLTWNGTGTFSGLGVTYGVTATTITATSFSSAPVVYVSTIQAGNQLGTSEDIDIMDASGNSMVYMDGGAAHGLRFNRQTFSGSRIFDSEFFGTTGTGPTLGFRGRDTTVVAADDLGTMYWRDNDSSTNGSTTKAFLGLYAGPVDWGSNTHMDSEFRLGTSRSGGNIATRMLVQSTSTIVQGLVVAGQGAVIVSTTQIIVSTAALDVRGGVSVSGGIKAIGPSTATYFYGNGSGLTNLPSSAAVFVSSSQYMAPFTIGTGNKWLAIPGSTVTITTTQSGRILGLATISWYCSNATDWVAFQPYIDGQRADTLLPSATYGVFLLHSPVANKQMDGSFAYNTDVLAAGTHTAYIAMQSNTLNCGINTYSAANFHTITGQ